MNMLTIRCHVLDFILRWRRLARHMPGRCQTGGSEVILRLRQHSLAEAGSYDWLARQSLYSARDIVTSVTLKRAATESAVALEVMVDGTKDR